MHRKLVENRSNTRLASLAVALTGLWLVACSPSSARPDNKGGEGGETTPTAGSGGGGGSAVGSGGAGGGSSGSGGGGSVGSGSGGRGGSSATDASSAAKGGSSGSDAGGADRMAAGEGGSASDAGAGGGDQTLPTGPKAALLLVRDPLAAEMPFGDVVLKRSLEAKGFTVGLVDDSDAFRVAPGAKSVGLVVISSSVSSESVAGLFKDIAVPVICLEPGIYDDMGMTGPMLDVDFGYKAMEGKIDIVAPTHPIAATLTATVALNVDRGLGYGVAPSAEKVASIAGNPKLLAIFAYKTGAKMVGMQKAPARRVGFPASDGNFGGMTMEAITLFEAATRLGGGQGNHDHQVGGDGACPSLALIRAGGGPCAFVSSRGPPRGSCGLAPARGSGTRPDRCSRPGRAWRS
jgi:hypothetical protein